MISFTPGARTVSRPTEASGEGQNATGPGGDPALHPPQSVCRYAVRFVMSVGDSDAMFPCCEVAHEPNRSAIVAAHPSCMRGVRQPTPTSGGTWNAPPVPTSTVVLFVNFAPAWQTEQPTSERWKIARPAAAAVGSTHVGGGGAGMALTHAESAPVWAVVREPLILVT